MAEIELAEGDPRHGTTNGYTNYRCRCADCRRANSDYQREYERRRRSARVEPNRQCGHRLATFDLLAQVERDLEETRAKVRRLERMRELIVELYGAR